jgi:hypothetical protein
LHAITLEHYHLYRNIIFFFLKRITSSSDEITGGYFETGGGRKKVPRVLPIPTASSALYPGDKRLVKTDGSLRPRSSFSTHQTSRPEPISTANRSPASDQETSKQSVRCSHRTTETSKELVPLQSCASITIATCSALQDEK